MQADSPKQIFVKHKVVMYVQSVLNFIMTAQDKVPKKHEQYLVANTVISNIFFQFLCLKVILNSTTHWYKESSKYSLG